LIAVVVLALVVPVGCGGGSSSGDDPSPAAVATEPAPEGAVSVDACLTKAGFVFQRQDASTWGATRNGRTFTTVRRFGSVPEAAAYEQQLGTPAHVRVGVRVASGASAPDLDVVESCLRGAEQK
jgi:hypothetical protein